MLLVATRKGLFRYRRGARGWETGPPAFLGEPVSAVLAQGGTLYAALRLGHFGVKLHRSEDAGENWTEVAAPAFPAGEDMPAVDMIWTLAADAGGLWAGTLPAALFRSTDRGQSWSLNQALWALPERKDWQGGGYDHPGLHTILVDPRDAQRLTLAISTGGVLKSGDGGAGWRYVGRGLRAEYVPPDKTYDLVNQDVHRLAACAAAPDEVWCQHHNGMFRSADGGETFSEMTGVKPSAFGFAVAAHPNQPGRAWFVPAIKDEYRVPVDGRLVVTRTSDGGKTFEALSEGLPAERSYDLIYRHALDVDARGETLAMGSTTGNLWIGEGGGARWRQIAGHLPPIAQVSFAPA